jgi:hypothetical protein
MKAPRLTLVAIGLLYTTISYGQEPSSASQFPQASQSPPLVQHHASTAFEGELRGRADGIRAMGEYNYNTATSALIFEEARKANYTNELRHAETFWAKRSLYDTQIATRKNRRLLHTQAKPEAEPIGLRVQPPFVAPSQPGFVWPAALNHPAFDATRGKLAVLFSQRSLANNGPQSESYVRIQNTTAEMRLLLTDLVREFPPMASVEARQFLDRVAYEAGLPVQEKVAAIN